MIFYLILILNINSVVVKIQNFKTFFAKKTNISFPQKDYQFHCKDRLLCRSLSTTFRLSLSVLLSFLFQILSLSLTHSFSLFKLNFPVSMSLFPNWSILFLPIYFILLNIRNTNTLSLYMYCKNARTCINTSSTNGKSRDGMSIIPNKDLVTSLV